MKFDTDYSTITELPGLPLTNEQYFRFLHRYALAGQLADDRRVLEVACGGGSGLRYLARLADFAVGLDYSNAVLAEAGRHAGAAPPLVCGDAQKLPFEEGSFDLILCFEAVYYLEDYGRFLQEVARLLSPGGVLLICWSNPNWPSFVPGRLTTTYPSADEVVKRLEYAGFQRIEMSGILPATTQLSVVHRVRQLALRLRLVPRRGPIAKLLSALAYGEMTPLPADLQAEEIERAANVRPTPIAGSHPDAIHRVLYAYAALPSAHCLEQQMHFSAAT